MLPNNNIPQHWWNTPSVSDNVISTILGYAKNSITSSLSLWWDENIAEDKEPYNAAPWNIKQFPANTEHPLFIKWLGPCAGIVIYDPSSKKYTLIHYEDSVGVDTFLWHDIDDISPDSIVICCGGNAATVSWNLKWKNKEDFEKEMAGIAHQVRAEMVTFFENKWIPSNHILQNRDQRKNNPMDYTSVKIDPKTKIVYIALFSGQTRTKMSVKKVCLNDYMTN